MATNILDYKIHQLERELKALKEKASKSAQKSKAGKAKGLSSLCGFLKGKTDLSLEEIQSFKYKGKGLKIN